MKYKKTLAELEKEAVKWWPKHLEAEVANSSVIPKLLETQDQFISVLKLAGARPEQIFDLIAAGAMPANLFLKHLVVLSDFGGELIKRLGAEFIKTFPVDAKTKHHYMSFTFKGENRRYKFKTLPVKGLSNPKLGIDGAAIVFPRNLDDLQMDVIMLLLYGGSSTSGHLASLERCELGLLLVASRTIIRFLMKQVGVGFVPVLHSLHRRFAFQGRLRELMVVQGGVPEQRFPHVLA